VSLPRTAGGRFGWERWPLAALIALGLATRWFIERAWVVGFMFLVGAIVFGLVAVRRR
jgi:hypothetical protein